MSKKVDIKDIFKIKSVAAPASVPGSDAVTYLVTHLDEEENSYVTNLHKYGHSGSRQLTFKKERISNVDHSPAGNGTVFIAKGEHDKPQVFLFRLEGGEREQLTAEKEGVNSALFSKDGAQIFYHVSNVPETGQEAEEEKRKEDQEKFPEPVVINRMKYKADSIGLVKEKYQAVKSLDLETRETGTLLSGDENYTLHAVIGEDTIVYSTDESEDRDFNFSEKLYIRKNGGESEEIAKEEGYIIKVDVSPDEKYLLVTHIGREFKNATHANISLYDIESGEWTELTKHLDKPVGDYVAHDTQQSTVMNPTAWISGSGFLFLLSEYGSVNLYKGDTEGEITPVLQDAHHVHLGVASPG